MEPLDTLDIRLELAGLDLKKNRHYPIAPVSVPREIWLEGEELVWDSERFDPRQKEFRTYSPQRTTLVEFLSLAEARSENVLRYAQKWGVLQLCKHGEPATHNRPPDFVA